MFVFTVYTELVLEPQEEHAVFVFTVYTELVLEPQEEHAVTYCDFRFYHIQNLDKHL